MLIRDNTYRGGQQASDEDLRIATKLCTQFVAEAQVQTLSHLELCAAWTTKLETIPMSPATHALIQETIRRLHHMHEVESAIEHPQHS